MSTIKILGKRADTVWVDEVSSMETAITRAFRQLVIEGDPSAAVVSTKRPHKIDKFLRRVVHGKKRTSLMNRVLRKAVEIRLQS